MRYNVAKKLQNGDEIIVELTDKTKTVVKTTECVGKGHKYVVILCDDGTAYYDFEVRRAR